MKDPNMVKLLRDICLCCLQRNLDRIPQVQRFLPTVYKELLIELLAKHDLLTEHYLCHVTYNLFVDNLKRVTFYRCEQVTDLVLKQLSASRCQLVHLSINKCVNVTDEGLLNVTKKQTELSTLSLQGLPSITWRGLVNIYSPQLNTLNLKDCSSVTAEGIIQLTSRNPTIRALILKGIPKLDDVVFSAIARNLQSNLEVLDVALVVMTDIGLEAIGNHCPNLVKLNAHGCNRISGTGLIKISQGCTQLKSLDLSYCNKLSSRPDSEALWTLPTSLTELSLCGILLEEEDLFVESVQRLKSLKSVRLSGVSALNDNTLTRILEHIGANLTELDISGSVRQDIGDEGMKAVSRYCHRLEVLSVSLLEKLTGVSLIPLFKDVNRASQIYKLLLSCRKLDVEVLHQVALHCSGLTLLDMSGLMCVEDELLFSLADNGTHLSHIGIKGCRRVTDEGVCELARCCPLESVVLSGIHSLTDKSIFALANNCHQLEEIFLNGCARITPAAIRYLEDCCIGRLFVRHVVPNADPFQIMAKNLDTGEFCRADLLTTH